MEDKILVEFDATVQSLAALQAAAYRTINVATCQINQRDGKWVCILSAKSKQGNNDPNNLRCHFIDVVSDENVRENLAKTTEPLRNLILSLAFGSLVHSKAKEDQQA